MATVNLGKIKLKWRGTWSSGGTYAIDDVVEYTDGSVTSSYIALLHHLIKHHPLVVLKTHLTGILYQKDKQPHQPQQGEI